MRDKYQKLFMLFLCGATMLLLFCMSVPAYADNGVVNKLDSLRSEFPEGKFWNHLVTTGNNNGDQLFQKWKDGDWTTAEAFQNNVTSSPCATHNGTALIGQYDCNVFDGGMQCCGFAKKIFYDVFGVRESSNELIRQPGYAGLMPGDYVHFSGFEHYAVVLSISRSTFTVVECNLSGDPVNGQYYPEYACMISWGREYSLSQIDYYVHAPNYDEINGGGGYTPMVSVSFSDWSNDQYTYIGTTDAAIGQAVSISGGTCSETGMYLYDSAGNYLAMAKQLVEYHDYIYFKINEECGYTLTPDREYRYKFYAVVNGETYWSNTGSFRTKPDAAVNRVVWTNMSCLPFKKSAYISANVSSASSGTFTEVGLKIWDQQGNLITQKIEASPNVQSFRVWYEVLSETGCALQAGTKYTYQLSAVLDGKEYQSDRISFTTETASEKHFGIDVSYAQGIIDWDTVAQYIDFAIIRCGYAGNYTSTDDAQWSRNVAECERLGIPYGVYLYSYAENDAEALDEAEHVLRLLSGHSPALPVYYDLEDASTVGRLSNEQIASQVQVFSKRVRQGGYKVGIYASASWWNGCLSGLSVAKDCRWYAAWDSSYIQEGSNNAIWQFTSDGHIPGISNSVDLNYAHAYRFGTIYPEQEKQYTITYDANGGSNPPAAQTKTEGVTLKLTTAVPTRTGYTFLGWAESQTATTAAYQPGGQYTLNASKTLYAVWKQKTYILTFDPNGGMVTIIRKSVAHGSAYGALPTPERVGYAFDGWHTSAEGGSRVTATTLTQNADHTLYAHWSPMGEMTLPEALKTIDDEAFMGDSHISHVEIPESCKEIGSKAFANCENLVSLRIQGKDTTFESDTFAGSPHIVIYCRSGSRAQRLASADGLECHLIGVASDWVLADSVPSGAEIVDRKWTYTLREYTQSASASYAGWTKYDSKRTSWSAWSGWQNEKITASSDREVRTQQVITGYNMVSYCVSGPQGRSYQPSLTYALRAAYGPYWWSKAEMDSARVFPAGSYFDFASNVAGYVLDGTGYCKWDGSETGGYIPMFIQETTYGTQWSSRDAVYTYYYYRDLNKEAAADPAGQENVANIQEWVKYVY